MMKIQFDPNLEYQQEAIKSICGSFSNTNALHSQLGRDQICHKYSNINVQYQIEEFAND